jgi:hypothetical protein
VLLDSRVTTKRYGKLFLDALPGCRRVLVDGIPPSPLFGLTARHFSGSGNKKSTHDPRPG